MKKEWTFVIKEAKVFRVVKERCSKKMVFACVREVNSINLNGELVTLTEDFPDIPE
jgi:hypothetical protein